MMVKSQNTYSTAQALKSFSSLDQSKRSVHEAVNWTEIHPQTPTMEHRPIERERGKGEERGRERKRGRGKRGERKRGRERKERGKF